MLNTPMNPINRYYSTQAVLTDDKQLIPLWDERLSLYGEALRFDSNWKDIFQTVDAILDIKTKTLSLGIVVDNYILEEKYVPGASVFVSSEYGNHTLYPAVIVEIVYEEYTSTIMKGSQLDALGVKLIEKTDKLIDPNALYEFRHWTPTYILDNSEKVRTQYRFYTILDRSANKD
jgi:hypothetical protein